jgi:hypothetical protein
MSKEGIKMNRAELVFKAVDVLGYPTQNILRFKDVVCVKDIPYGEGKRQKARDIFSSVDQIFMEMGFYSKSYTTTPAIYNSEVYSITATHEAVIGADGTIYRG